MKTQTITEQIRKLPCPELPLDRRDPVIACLHGAYQTRHAAAALVAPLEKSHAELLAAIVDMAKDARLAFAMMHGKPVDIRLQPLMQLIDATATDAIANAEKLNPACHE